MSEQCVKNALKIALCFALVLPIGEAAAQDKEPQDDTATREILQAFVQGRLTKKQARKVAEGLAIAITKVAHPTSSNPDLLNHTVNRVPGGVEILLKIEYFGGFVGRRYPATISLMIDTLDPSDWVVKELSFRESVNQIPSNKQNLSLFRRKLNQMLSE